MFLTLSRTSRWQKSFRATHPYMDGAAVEPEGLRLILGVGRSGTSWVCHVLFKTTMPCRCFSEPLFRLAPRLPFQKQGDHTAINYEQLSPEHPLARAYQLLTRRQFGGPAVKTLERDDVGWKICLVKEVHSLLGSEGLLRLWRPPAIFILRDPLYVVDSLFAAQTLQTIYLDHEMVAVRQPAFLERFAPGRQKTVDGLFSQAARLEPRGQAILSKVLCIQLLQEMFTVLAREFPCATALRYEQLCETPRQTFPVLAGALGIPWDDAMDGCLARTMTADATSSDPYSVMRNTEEQKDRPFKFLSADEAKLCREATQTIKGDSAPSDR